MLVLSQGPSTCGRLAFGTEPSAAYNRCIESAKGSFIAFLDDDDVYEPWHLAQFAEAHHRHPDGQFFASRAWLWDPVTGHKRLMPGFNPATLAQDALVSTVIVPQEMLVARSALLEVGGFPEDRALMGAEDWLLLIKLSQRFRAVKLSRPSLRVREHPGRSMNNLDVINRSRDAAARVVLEGPLGAELDSRSRQLVAAGTHRFVAGHLYAMGRMGQARARLAQARRELGPVEGQLWTARLWVQTWLGQAGSAALRRLKRRLLWR